MLGRRSEEHKPFPYLQAGVGLRGHRCLSTMTGLYALGYPRRGELAGRLRCIPTAKEQKSSAGRFEQNDPGEGHS